MSQWDKDMAYGARFAAQCRLERERDQLKAECERRGGLLEDVVNVALTVGGIPESTPNAVGSFVSSEPSPAELVLHAIRITRKSQEAENERLTENIRILHDEVIARYRRERDQLKTDNERLREACMTWSTNVRVAAGSDATPNEVER